MSLEQIWAIRLRVIWVVMLSNPTPGPFSRPTRLLSSSSFHKPLPCNNIGQVTAAHGSSSQPAVARLEELNPIPTLETTAGSRGRHENSARKLTNAGGRASTKRVAIGGRRKGIGAKRGATANANKKMHPAFVLFVKLTVMKDRNGYNVEALVYPGSMRNVSS